VNFGPPWCDYLGIDFCRGNIPAGQRVVSVPGKIGLGLGFWNIEVADVDRFIMNGIYYGIYQK